MPDSAEAGASWSLVIEELRAQLARIKAGQEPGDWSPPSVAGPLPEEYAGAVRELIEKQRSVMEALEEARRRTGEHLVAVRAAEPARGYHAAYLDVEG